MKLDLNGSGMYKQAAEGATRFSLLYPLSVLNYIHDPNKDTFKTKEAEEYKTNGKVDYVPIYNL